MKEAGIRVLEPKKRVGLVVVLTGYGKGKTTSALGMALRAVGHDMRVCLIHFMKGSLYAGEISSIKRLAPDIEIHLTGKGFCKMGNNLSPGHKHRAYAQEAIKLARDKMLSNSFDTLILDEINNAIELNLVDLSQVLELIDNKPPLMHLILTGRDAHPEVIKRAHTATEMREIRHAYRQGIEAQKGIDY